MDLKPLPFRSPLSAYEQQAEELLSSHGAADPAAIDLFHRKHPRFLDDKIKWLPKAVPDSEIAEAALTHDDARLATARYYDFLDWSSLAAWAEAIAQQGAIFEFESAVQAVVEGDLDALQDALRGDPRLVGARSSRVCFFDPPVHRATLLHYVAANGVEAYRQKTPPNAVEIARALLQADAEPDALADMYGAECTTMSMLVSSSHPAEAGVQVPLIDLLLDFGAAIEGRGTRKWGGPLFTALTFGMIDAANALAGRGARIDLPNAAGLGLVDDATRLLPSADDGARHRALSVAAQHGHAEIVSLLLDAGEVPTATIRKATIRTRRPCIKPSWAVTRWWCGSWSRAARGWISGTPFGGARRSVGRFMTVEKSRLGWPSACDRSAHRNSRGAAGPVGCGRD